MKKSILIFFFLLINSIFFSQVIRYVTKLNFQNGGKLVNDREINEIFEKAIENSKFLKFSNNTDIISFVINANSFLFFDNYRITLEAFDNISRKNILTKTFTIEKENYEKTSYYIISFIEELEKYSQELTEDLYRVLFSDNKIAQSILSQGDNYMYYKVANFFYKVNISRNNIIMINEQEKDFYFEFNGEKIYSKNSNYILSTTTNNILELNIFNLENPKDSISLKIKPEKISIIKVNFKNRNSRLLYKFYFDNSIFVTTLGNIGYDFRFGINLPPNSEKHISLFVRNSLSYNLPETIIKQNFSYFTFLFGAGLKYHFYIFNIFAINFGLEFGLESIFYKRIYEKKRYVDLDFPGMGFPAFYTGIPLEFEYPLKNNFSFIGQISPTIRIINRTFYYEDALWAGDLDYNNLYKELLIEIYDERTMIKSYIDPFIYNMPIFIGFRVKIK